MIEIRLAISVGPPKPRMVHVQRGSVFGVEVICCVACGARSRAARRRCSRWFRGPRLGPACRSHSRRLPARRRRPNRSWQRQIGGHERIFQHDRPGGGEIDLLPDAGVAIVHGVKPVPANGAKKRGPSMALMPPFWPTPSRSVCSWGTPGCGCGVTRTATTAWWPGLTCAVISKMPRMKAPRMVPIFAPFTHTSAE